MKGNDMTYVERCSMCGWAVESDDLDAKKVCKGCKVAMEGETTEHMTEEMSILRAIVGTLSRIEEMLSGKATTNRNGNDLMKRDIIIYHPGTGTVISLSDEVYAIDYNTLPLDLQIDVDYGTLSEANAYAYGVRLDNYNVTNMFFGGIA